jgi:xylan 1,4-beta-xylosidase
MQRLLLLGILSVTMINGFSQTTRVKEKSVDNPITVLLSGDYADPSILKDGNNYYMTNTSINYFPGLRLWHSTDLKNWKPIGYALTKYVGEVWAPDFIKHGDTYYIYFPAYPGTNWVVTAKSPYGPWSEPIDLHVKGIDPGHIVGTDGKRYLYFNDGKVAELNADGLSLKEEPRKVYEGWQYPKDWTVECMCAESPKLHFYNGWYYLTTAQGGTSGPGTSHMVVQARSKSPLGPWENSPYNPIVHTYSSSENWWSKGHGTIVQKPGAGWAVVYHAYEKNNLPHGRQVLMEDLEYTKDGWYHLQRNPMVEGSTVVIPNLKTVSDDFYSEKLHEQWQFSEMYNPKDATIANGKLIVNSYNDSIKAMHTTVGNPNYEIAIELNADSTVETGLIAYYRDNGYAGISIKGNKISRVGTSLKYGSPGINIANIRFLKIRILNYDLTMQYSTDGINWITYPNSMNLQTYQHNNLGRFSSLKPGIYWKGKGKLMIDNFTFKAL